jgi:hypothetical protein
MSKDVPEDRRRSKEREINKTTRREIKVRKMGLKITEINNNNNKEYDKSKIKAEIRCKKHSQEMKKGTNKWVKKQSTKEGKKEDTKEGRMLIRKVIPAGTNTSRTFYR